MAGPGPRSTDLWQQAVRYLAGGVNSPSRSFATVGGDPPVFMARGEGAYLYDVDGRRYLDYLAAFGALILGHGHPRVAEAVARTARTGTLFGTPTALEVEFARRLHEAIPMAEEVRFTASGTEAVMTAIRLARGYTGRDKILKFNGSYHGHADPVLISAGSGTSTLGLAESAGIPAGVRQDVLSVPYNDLAAAEAAFDRYGDQIAAVLVEPVVGNFGIVPPEGVFLAGLTALARLHGALVIHDEVITAFRFRYGAVHPLFETEPDLIVLGKVIGGGLPVGAYGGRREIMAFVAPRGPVYQDGTWAGNPLSMAAGLACLEELARPGLYERLATLGERLAAGIRRAAATAGVPLQVNQFGGALAVYFTDRPVQNFETVEAATDDAAFTRFFRAMLARGICLPPSKYEAWFVSACHTEADIHTTLNAVEDALRDVARGGAPARS